MSVDFAYDMWTELKRYIISVDRSEAAEVLVNLLIDNDIEAAEIKDVFKKDEDVKAAIQNYFDESNDESDFDYDDNDQDLDDY